MTNEEAIQLLKTIYPEDTEWDRQAFDLAIASLEREEWVRRAIYLLGAAYRLLDKQNQSPYVLNILNTIVFYDGVECDGSCLMDDIEEVFYRAGIELDAQPEEGW